MHALQPSPSFDPIAMPGAIISTPQARFTILSSRLVRMEYSPTGYFEDSPSQAFWYRNQPVPEFSTRVIPNGLEIETEHLVIHYDSSPAKFTPHSLQATVKATGQTWHYSDPYWRAQNLMGTARTLDNAQGAVRLEPGLISRSGWAVVDDSQSLVFSADGWLAPRQHPENLDLYLFGYGHDYPACLREFSLVAGAPAMIPRWILGNWWSRYWAFTQEELLALMEEFYEHQLPLSVCIVDMDWHITRTGNRSRGWTGYTWNNELFPDPVGFIDQLHQMGLKTSLNLHPADGVYPHEAQYPALAEFLSIDAAQEQPIPFDCADRRFMQGYFELLHHPLEKMGVDFWWLDWQQGKRSQLANLDPLWWLNHLHFYDLGRDGVKRPFIFSRWGGLGNHRYPIGFSGDTVVGWEALHNQPGFTATAANVGYGWWSHDIGGHMGGIEDDELYTRWLQYGVFSPILRMHCTNSPYHERRPWGRGPAAERAAIQALRLRHTLIPYLYSMAWRNTTTSLPLVTPLYYTHPEEPQAYQVPQLYWFGSELLAAPFTSPAHPETGLSRQTLWLPEGDWFNFFTGEVTRGGWCTVYGLLEDIPVFASAGAIIPLGRLPGWGGVGLPEQIHLVVFPGADNSFDLVEDDGETTAYQDGKYAVTTITQTWLQDKLILEIHPPRGDRQVLPATRSFQVELRGISQPEQVEVQVNSSPITLEYSYDLRRDALRFNAINLAHSDSMCITVQAQDGLISQRDRKFDKLRTYLSAFKLDTRVKTEIDAHWAEILAGRANLRAYSDLTDAQIAVLDSLLHQARED